MTALTTVLIFAKQGDAADVALGTIFLAVVVVVGLIAAALRGPAHYDLVIKNGLPYCPRCNRQVSYRRNYCRACGYTFKTYGAAAPTAAGFDRRYARDEEEAAWLAGWLETEEGRRESKARREVEGSAEEAGDQSNEVEGRGVERARRRAARLEERRIAAEVKREAGAAYYRERGVEPGLLAWYRVLPEWQQAILLGVAFAAPIVGLIVLCGRAATR